MIREFVLVAIAALAVAGCADTPTSTLPTATRLPTSAHPPAVTTTPAPQPSTAAPIPAGCQPAPADTVATISAAFPDPSYSLADVYAVTAPGGVLTYVGANIMQGTTKASSADVWVARGAVVYSLSGDARRRTTLPDGRKMLSASAGDDYGTKVQTCVTTAERARNQSGGR
ncbi:hypothetical protein NRB56_68710 [Nocardia sp. RB56]|uniref:Lipoprotein n=2 Tax=Nocardia aurantia TaxID=2585199 RepID=A0A7K0E1H1_9NOCA|nr:hypothetical protein [Nocardia aurantia]